MRIIGVLLLCGLLLGCATWQKTVTKFAADDQMNAQTTRIAAREIGSTWSLNSGALTVALDKFQGLLPCKCADDIKTMDTLTAKCIAKDTSGRLTCEELTDNEMGRVVVLWGWIWGSIVKSGMDKIMETFFPSLLAQIMPYVTAFGL